jgi:hypothetical protein
MSTITTKDGTQIYYKDWGTGPVITFSHTHQDQVNAALLTFIKREKYNVANT